jgi:mono/diheme cytochrome c family protein
MMKILIGALLGFAIILGGALLYVRLGFAPVATSVPPMPFEVATAKMASAARIARDAPFSAPIPADEAAFTAGAQIYRQNCAVCPGLRNQPPSPIATGMFPKPPQLFKSHGVTDNLAGETYWKVKNGIRLTGMPANGSSLKDQQLWQLSLLLANADKLPANIQKLLSEPPTF